MAEEAATGLGKGVALLMNCGQIGTSLLCMGSYLLPKCFIQSALVSPGCDVPVVEQAGGDDSKLAGVTLGAVVPWVGWVNVIVMVTEI